jgi:uncharacterized protein YecA (UPF0149 family)
MGHVPDGVFNIIGDTIEIVSAPARTFQELTRLAEILKAAQTSRRQSNDVARDIQNELPALSPLMKLLPENKSEWFAFLAVVLAVVQVYLAANPPGSPQSSNITVNNVIEQTLIIEQRSTAPVKRPGARKVGRNETCPCGSGTKYKKCCGASK